MWFLVWFHSTSILTLVLLFCTWMFGHLFSMCYTFHGASIWHISWNVKQRATQWNFSGSGFHLKIDAVFYSCIILSFCDICFFGNEVLEADIYWSSVTVKLLHFQGFCLCYQVTLDLSWVSLSTRLWVKHRNQKCNIWTAMFLFNFLNATAGIFL